MSQSTTTDGQSQTPVQCSQTESQNETYDQRLRFNYPDRQEEMVAESTDESFAPCSVNSEMSASPVQTGVQLESSETIETIETIETTTTHTRTFTEEEIQKVRDDINEMNQRFAQHGYEAFVHNKMHFIFRVFPFDLQ